MTLYQYITNVNILYKLGLATEHNSRDDLKQLIEGLMPEIMAKNQPKRQKFGLPNYILNKKDIPVGFIEAKEIGDCDFTSKK